MWIKLYCFYQVKLNNSCINIPAQQNSYLSSSEATLLSFYPAKGVKMSVNDHTATTFSTKNGIFRNEFEKQWRTNHLLGS